MDRSKLERLLEMAEAHVAQCEEQIERRKAALAAVEPSGEMMCNWLAMRSTNLKSCTNCISMIEIAFDIGCSC